MGVQSKTEYLPDFLEIPVFDFNVKHFFTNSNSNLCSIARGNAYVTVARMPPFTESKFDRFSVIFIEIYNE